MINLAAAISKDNAMLMETQLHKQATECKTFQVQNLLGEKGVCVRMLFTVHTCLMLHNQQETRCKNTQ